MNRFNQESFYEIVKYSDQEIADHIYQYNWDSLIQSKFFSEVKRSHVLTFLKILKEYGRYVVFDYICQKILSFSREEIEKILEKSQNKTKKRW